MALRERFHIRTIDTKWAQTKLTTHTQEIPGDFGVGPKEDGVQGGKGAIQEYNVISRAAISSREIDLCNQEIHSESRRTSGYIWRLETPVQMLFYLKHEAFRVNLFH